jgi:hypothetical protein
VLAILLTMTAHRMDAAASAVFEAGTLITGFTVQSCFPTVRTYPARTVLDIAAWTSEFRR